MDTRDKYLLQHHKRRLAAASLHSTERQRMDALRHLQIATAQHRLAYSVLMRMWLDTLDHNAETRSQDR